MLAFTVVLGGCADLVSADFDRAAFAPTPVALTPVAVLPEETAGRDLPPFALQYAASAASDIGDLSVAEADQGDGDPFEVFNRFMFAINETLDVFIIRPVAVTYRFWVPEGVRDSVQNFLRNLSGPIIFVNDVLQGDLQRAETTGSRFFINTVLGLGFFDHASGLGLVYHDEDFGQTLAVYGLGEGAYLVLPLFGPSSVRDGVGLLVDSIIDPVNYALREADENDLILARSAATGIDLRSRNIESLDEAKRDALDFYARVRSLWRQQRDAEIRNEGEAGPNPNLSRREAQAPLRVAF